LLASDLVINARLLGRNPATIDINGASASASLTRLTDATARRGRATPDTLVIIDLNLPQGDPHIRARPIGLLYSRLSGSPENTMVARRPCR
jgi:hypothetical protein